MTTYKSLSKSQQKTIREIVKHWKIPSSPYTAGGHFILYHNILMLYNNAKYQEIVETYWKSMHNYLDVLPCLVYDGDAVDVHYQYAALALLEHSVDKVASYLNT